MEQFLLKLINNIIDFLFIKVVLHVLNKRTSMGTFGFGVNSEDFVRITSCGILSILKF